MFIFIYVKEHNWGKKDFTKNICLTWISYFKKKVVSLEEYFSCDLFNVNFIKNGFL